MPIINRILDVVTLEYTRGFFSRITYSVYHSTGYRFHPATFQMIAVLLLVVCAYWVYVFHCSERKSP